MDRIRIKVTGESGMGLLSVGRIASKALKKHGFFLNVDREYPSLIKGGHSSLQVDFSGHPVRSLSREADLLLALDQPGLLEYLETVKEGGVVLHTQDRHAKIKGLAERAKSREIQLIFCPARQIVRDFGGTDVMVNMVLLGVLWKILGLSLEFLESEIRQQFAAKPGPLKIDIQCVRAGYKWHGVKKFPAYRLFKPSKKLNGTILIDGNTALALGALQAGTRAYFAYPMSPMSSVLAYAADCARDTGMLVKQAEDEITAIQMAAGAMWMGARSFTCTSGGGFDLMTETVSLAGMTETPLVVVIGQRPGPATGLPTWSSQGDLNLAIHSGHGEYPRLVMAASDPQSCFELIQRAFNFSEEFQIPVILLTEKTIAETQTIADCFKKNLVPIRRGIITDPKTLSELSSSDRYRFTPSGVSPRWIPGSSPAVYCSNSDEHEQDGTLTEAADPVAQMTEKRMRKMESLRGALPDPEIFGVRAKADFSFVGWGSSKNVMRDVIAHYGKKLKINYLHFDYIHPLKTKVLERFFKENKNVHLIESNFQGQFGRLAESMTGLKFAGKLLKYNGRPFFLEDVIGYIANVTLSASCHSEPHSGEESP